MICGCPVYKKSPFHTDNLSVQKRRRFIFSVVPLFLTQLMRPLITSDNVYSGNGEFPAQPTDTNQRPYVPPAAQRPVILNTPLPTHTCRRLSAKASRVLFSSHQSIFHDTPAPISGAVIIFIIAFSVLFVKQFYEISFDFTKTVGFFFPSCQNIEQSESKL